MIDGLSPLQLLDNTGHLTPLAMTQKAFHIRNQQLSGAGLQMPFSQNMLSLFDLVYCTYNKVPRYCRQSRINSTDITLHKKLYESTMNKLISQNIGLENLTNAQLSKTYPPIMEN
jgi:hypothetical protein